MMDMRRAGMGKDLFHLKNSHISKGYKRLQQIVNNKTMRTKIIYLYIFCALVPVFVSNVIIIGTTLRASVQERQDKINNISDSIANNIASSFENAAYIAIDLYASNSIATFLDTQYKSESDYFSAYQSVFKNYVFYSSSKYLIQDITLYSDNKTMVNGGRYYRIDSVQSEEWYKSFKSSDAELMILSYFNESDYPNAENKIISLIRYINFYGRTDVEKIVKMDLNYGKMAESVKDASFGTTIYVTNGDNILFSTQENNKSQKNPFKKVADIANLKVDSHKSYSSYGYDFDIYLVGYETDYIAVLKERMWMLVILLIADAAIPIFILILVGHSITERVLLVGDYMNQVKNESFDLIEEEQGIDEIGEMIENYNLMIVRMRDLIQYEYKSKLERQSNVMARQQAELLALYSQINPHFMFNVLETIRMRSVIKDEQETAKMIESLAKLMRKSAEWGSDLITLDKEISFAKDYLELQKYRFGDAFDYRIRIPEDCKEYVVPSLSLVTFIENACVHGLNKEDHSGMIFISAYIQEAYLTIEIEDTGVGMDQEQADELERLINEADILDLQKRASLGTLNAGIRLKKYCNEETHIFVESEKGMGTCIIIQIPVKRLSNHEKEV